MGKKIVRAATIGMSLNIFCKGLGRELADEGYEVVALASPDDDLKELGEREGVRVIGVPMERHVNPFKDILSLYPNVETEYVSHSEFKEKTKSAKTIIRTGECTPYSNIILVSKVCF